MIKALIFDCFGVFYADPVLSYMRDPATPPDKAEALNLLDEQAAVGALDKKEFVVRAASLLDISEADSERRFFYGNDRNERLIEFMQGLHASYSIAMLSNIGGDMMDGFFSAEERERLFDTTILSGDVKMAKPDRAIFELVCEQLGVALHEAVMIDDRQHTCDVVKTFGMESICYKDFEKFEADLSAILT